MNTPASFPNGAKLAVVIGMFFESFEGTPQPNPLPPVSGVEGRYVLADSWVDYGPAVGVNRLLDLLDQFQLPASFGISGLSAERYPEITRQIVDKGHEAVAHSYAQDIRVYTLDEEQERRNIERNSDRHRDCHGSTARRMDQSGISMHSEHSETAGGSGVRLAWGLHGSRPTIPDEDRRSDVGGSSLRKRCQRHDYRNSSGKSTDVFLPGVPRAV